MFADDTNLFLSNWDTSVSFATVNGELSKIKHWFPANKLSLLTSKKQQQQKKQYSFFHKTNKNDDTSLKLRRLQVNNYNIERIPSIKLLGVLLDENLLWRDHIQYTKNKFL